MGVLLAKSFQMSQWTHNALAPFVDALSTMRVWMLEKAHGLQRGDKHSLVTDGEVTLMLLLI